MANEHKLFDKITIYDAFLEVVGHDSITLEQLQDKLWLTDDSNAEECLEQLVAMNLLVKDGEVYSLSNTDDCLMLRQVLAIALSVGLDYNFYLSDDVRALYTNAYGRHAFSSKHLAGKLDDIYRLVRRLCMDSIAVIFTYSPVTAKLVPNTFSDSLCAYWHIIPIKPGFFERRIKTDVVINDRLDAQKKKDRITLIEGSRVFFDQNDTSEVLRYSAGKLQNLVRFDVIPSNPEVFDSEQTTKTKKARDLVMSMVDSKRQLNCQLIGKYHALCLYGDDEIRPYRKYEVTVANNPKFHPVPADRIEHAMQNMIENYKHDIARANTLNKALELAAYIYSEIIYIQPYEDGNSRTSMMAMLHVLNILKTGIEVVPPCYDIYFIQLTKGAPKRNDKAVQHLLEDICLMNINKADLKEMLEYR